MQTTEGETKMTEMNERIENPTYEQMTEKQALRVNQFRGFVERQCRNSDGSAHYEIKRWEVAKVGELIFVMGEVGLPGDEGKMTELWCRDTYHIGFMKGGACLT